MTSTTFKVWKIRPNFWHNLTTLKLSNSSEDYSIPQGCGKDWSCFSGSTKPRPCSRSGSLGCKNYCSAPASAPSSQLRFADFNHWTFSDSIQNTPCSTTKSLVMSRLKTWNNLFVKKIYPIIPLLKTKVSSHGLLLIKTLFNEWDILLFSSIPVWRQERQIQTLKKYKNKIKWYILICV